MPGFTEAAATLTESERLWLQQQNNTLRVGIAEVPPQQAYLNEHGKLEGLAIEYLDAVEAALGVEFERVLAPSYGDMMRMARAREIDIVYAASRTAERETFLSFTSPYNYVSNNIFVRAGDEPLNSLALFSGERFAVTEGSAVSEYVHTHYPDINLVKARSSAEAFNMLTAGQVRGAAATAASAYKYAYEAGLHNVALSGSLGYDYAISMAGRNDWPVLTGILQKALDSLSSAQIETIQARWSSPSDSARVDLAQLREYLLVGALSIGLLVLTGLFLWNRMLQREVAQRRQAEARLEFLAYHDVTTGLLNRSGFLQALERCECQQGGCGLVLLGLDEFRVKNELWGQQTGNEILHCMGVRLKSVLPEPLALARIGGDVFAILFTLDANEFEKCTVEDNPLPQGHESGRGERAQLSAFAERLLEEVRCPMQLSDNSRQVISATCGGVVMSDGQERVTLCLQQAEVALKYAKREQRGGFMLYNASMWQDDTSSLRWTEQLLLAIKSGQLFLEYQPQLDLQRHRVVGFEALVRWLHPERGRVPPGEFISHAEQSGLISALGEWVLKEACRQACTWRMQGLDFDYVAVNVSVRQFVDADFARKVLRVLEETGLPAHCLELEITETLFMNEYDSVCETLHSLSRHGIRFSIDDFGTGFSSLLYLKQLPVETIKLAQEFVLDITGDASSRQIVSAATQLGHSLGMRVIAEGVEDEAVEQVLQDLNCDVVQGYLYSKPVPVSEVSADWMQRLALQSRAVTVTRHLPELS